MKAERSSETSDLSNCTIQCEYPEDHHKNFLIHLVIRLGSVKRKAVHSHTNINSVAGTHAASIFRVDRMKAAGFSAVSVNYCQTVQRHIS